MQKTNDKINKLINYRRLNLVNISIKHLEIFFYLMIELVVTEILLKLVKCINLSILSFDNSFVLLLFIIESLFLLQLLFIDDFNLDLYFDCILYITILLLFSVLFLLVE